MTTTTAERGTSAGRAPGERRRPGQRPPAERVAHLAHLDLPELRAYRLELQTEENRVSYWRRILQARLDAAAGFGEPRVAPSRLAPVVAEQQTASRRLAALTVHDATATPPLPDLAVLWDSTAEDADSALLTRLADAEAELSAYRHALHSRLDDATDELIARYREEPTLALTALPGPRRG